MIKNEEGQGLISVVCYGYSCQWYLGQEERPPDLGGTSSLPEGSA